MAYKQAQLDGQPGVYDDASDTFYAQSALKSAKLDGKPGYYHQESDTFFPEEMIGKKLPHWSAQSSSDLPTADKLSPNHAAISDQRIGGKPVAPDMPTSAEEMQPQGMNESVKSVFVNPIRRAGLESLRSAAMVAQPFADKEGKEELNRFMDATTQKIKALSPRADDGFVQNLVGGAVSLAPYLVTGGLGAATLLANAASRGLDAIDEGVDPRTATKLMVKDLATTAVMFKLPMGGKTLTTGMAKGAAANVGLDIASKAVEKGILTDADYKDLAKKIELMNPSSMGSSALMGAWFGAQQSPSSVADVLSGTKGGSWRETLSNIVNHHRYKEESLTTPAQESQSDINRTVEARRADESAQAARDRASVEAEDKQSIQEGIQRDREDMARATLARQQSGAQGTRQGQDYARWLAGEMDATGTDPDTSKGEISHGTEEEKGIAQAAKKGC